MFRTVGPGVLLALAVGLIACLSAQAQVTRVGVGRNPYTGRVGTAAAGYNPYTGRVGATRQAYNPYTGGRAATGVYRNPYTGQTGAYRAGFGQRDGVVHRLGLSGKLNRPAKQAASHEQGRGGQGRSRSHGVFSDRRIGSGPGRFPARRGHVRSPSLAAPGAGR
jgi:hypothetical protein